MTETAPISDSAPGPESERRIRVVMNAGSGSGEAAQREAALQAAFARHPGRFELHRVEAGGSIAQAAADAVADGCDTVVAAGGDGTIAGVASVVAGSGATFGVLPFGTFNFFARGLGLPDDIDAAVAVLAGGHTVEFRIGEVNGAVFLNNASLGAYAQILQNREEIYGRWGRSRLAAYWSALTTLARFHRPLTLKVTVDGEVRRVSTPLAFVANNAHQLDLFDLAGAECIRDGSFALFIAPDCTRWQLVRFAMRLAFRSMKPERDYALICGHDIVVESRRRHRLVARDGERQRMAGPYRFRHRPEPLRVLVPAGAAP